MKTKGLISSKIGFTVIELLVVIAVIGLLASIVLVSLGPAQKKARDSRRAADLRQINTAMELCYDDAGCAGAEKYIDSAPVANDVKNIDTDSTPCFLCPVPTDKLDKSPYQYTWTDGTTAFYCAYAKLEAETDTWVCASNKGTQKKTLAAYTPTSQDCCGLNASGCSCNWAAGGVCVPACGAPTPQCCLLTCTPAGSCPDNGRTRCAANAAACAALPK